MDDWYVTHALLNNTNTLYVDLSKRYLIVDLVNEDAETKPSLPYIFGHFRPSKRY